MFHRWFMRHNHPAFAWGGAQPGPAEGWEGAEESQARGPFGPPWAWGMRHGFQGGPQGGPPWAGGRRHHGHGGPFGGWGRHHGFEEGPEGPQGEPPWGGGHHHGHGGPFGGGWWMRRGFPGGPGPGPGGPGPRAFGRGDLKYQLLALLAERPKHGYEMIKELEAQAGGFYTPSAGAVYPSLQLMEDRGWVTSQTVDGKKTYTISADGRAALAEYQRQGAQAEQPHGPGGWGRGRPPFGGFGMFGGRGPFGRHVSPELAALGQESREVTFLLFNAVMATGGDPAKLARLREIIASTRRHLEEFVGQQPAAGGDAPPTSRLPNDVL